ncbi:ribonuclease P protein component [Agromyces seonyuensis]|uniref:Ribonuclease P protein component n=1 Tax=Agromyces seonyuensis TaxID=2662446 RepID=A0A6I4P2L1_9MICO|nr:ribonuclease P protein component [Agromyces seonyuensis]
MLARANRLTSAEDYRVLVRRGARSGGAHIVSYYRITGTGVPARFGFIVSKKVGNAVCRNSVRRRLKAASRGLVDAGFSGVDVVFRALPSAADAGWDALERDVQKTGQRTVRTEEH